MFDNGVKNWLQNRRTASKSWRFNKPYRLGQQRSKPDSAIGLRGQPAPKTDRQARLRPLSSRAAGFIDFIDNYNWLKARLESAFKNEFGLKALAPPGHRQSGCSRQPC